MKARCAAAAALVLLAACGGKATSTSLPPASDGSPQIHVIDAKILLGPDHEAVVSFAAHNAGPATDRLVSAGCACARRVELVGAGTIGSEVTGVFGPNGDHPLLHGLDPDLTDGQFADVTLTFEHAGKVRTEAEIVEP